MRKLHNLIPLALCVIAVVLLSFHLDITQRFLYFYREQQQLFLYDCDFLSDRYIAFGGLALFLAQFIVQFFSVAWVGPIATAFLGVLMSYVLWKSLRRLSSSLFFLPISFIPFLYQVEAMFDFNFGYQGFIALLLMVLAFCLYTAVGERMKWQWRILLSTSLALVLYLAAGPVGLLFAVMVLLYDLFTRAKKFIFQLIPIALVLLVGFMLVLGGHVESERFAFLNDFYYEPILKAGVRFLLSWFAILAVLVFAFIASLAPKTKSSIDILIAVILFVPLAWLFIQSANKTRKNIIFPIVEIQHYIVTEQWDKILDSRYLKLNNYLISNYTNLALSHKGMLLSQLFAYPQDGVNSLMLQGSFAEMNLESFVASPHIFYQMGSIAVARNKAFDASVAFQYGNPTIAKMLAKTNIIYGDYPIAERYVKMLEKTWGYSDWAKEYSRFLYNDEAVENDSELGLKRKDLPKRDTNSLSRGLYVDLVSILETNTPDKSALEYAIACLLLSRDEQNIKAFAEKFFGTPVMPQMPVLLQEALVESCENDLGFCRSHGVTEETINRYNDFQNTLMMLQMGETNEALFEQKYSRTYWYYSMGL